MTAEVLYVGIIGNLGFVWTGKEMHIRVLCPDNPMIKLVSYEHTLEVSRRRARSQHYRAKLAQYKKRYEERRKASRQARA